MADTPSRYQAVFDQVERAYTTSHLAIAHWMWEHHVQFVAAKASELAQRFGADEEKAGVGALLHDFGDASVLRAENDHEQLSTTKATYVLQTAGFSDKEITEILDVIIAPHSCYENNLPTTLEAKVLATADALAHLSTNFFWHFAWMHIPEDKSFDEFLTWAQEKIERDFHHKIFFSEIKTQAEPHYEALKLLLHSSTRAL